MSHLDPQRFPGPACGSRVLPPPPLVFWRVHLTHVCHPGLHPHGSHPSALLTVTCQCGVPGPGPSFPVGGSSRASLRSPWPLASWAQRLISITVDLAITHPSPASPPSSSCRAHLASRALYMVGFHSFVCTFGEGLLCARPCARHRVNGHWPCKVHASGRRPGAGGWPSASGTRCRGQSWLPGSGRGAGSSAESR